jgi:hypothetical protein
VTERVRKTWENVSYITYKWKKREMEFYTRGEGGGLVYLDKVKVLHARIFHAEDISIDTEGYPGKEPSVDIRFPSPATCLKHERFGVFCYIPEKAWTGSLRKYLEGSRLSTK